jgi:hypothetical protein
VAEAFLTALLAGRCEEAVNYLVADLRPAASSCADLPLPQGLGALVEPVVGESAVDGDRATVDVGFVTPGSQEGLAGTGFVLELEREPVGWRIRTLETK